MRTRIFNCYGPQENSEASKYFYFKLDEEIESAINAGTAVVIEMDCNAKLGSSIIKGDPHQMSENGAMLNEILIKHNLMVLNSSEKCKGLITRRRDTIKGIEESVIDFIVVSQEIIPFIECTEIDDKRLKALTNFSKQNELVIIKKSDHNVLTASFNIPVKMRKPMNKEIFSLRNKEQLFQFTDNTDDAKELIECFLSNDSIKHQGKKWLKLVKNKIHKSFKKIKIKPHKIGKNKSHIYNKINHRNRLRKLLLSQTDIELKHKFEDDLDKIEDDIAEQSAREHAEMIKEHVKEMCTIEGNFSNNKMWNLRKKIFKKQEPPTAKLNENGTLVTNPDMLKNLTLNAFVHRLRHRKIVPELKKYQTLQEELFQIRLKS